jgi:hypothetical protein
VQFLTPWFCNDPSAAFRAKDDVVVKTQVRRRQGENPRTLSARCERNLRLRMHSRSHTAKAASGSKKRTPPALVAENPTLLPRNPRLYNSMNPAAAVSLLSSMRRKAPVSRFER